MSSAAVRPRRLRRVGGLAALMMCTAACVTSPEGDGIENWSTIDELEFRGYAEFPSSEIHLEAYDYSTSQWNVVETFDSSTSANNFEGYTFYRWHLDDFDFTAVPSWPCYWDTTGTCDTTNLGAEARVRFIEPSSTTPTGHMVTFDLGGVACVIEAVAEDGDAWPAAGFRCRSADSPVITLKIVH